MTRKKYIQNQQDKAIILSPEEELKRERARLRTQKCRDRKKARDIVTVYVDLERKYFEKFEAACKAKALDLPNDMDQRRLEAKAKTIIVQDSLDNVITSFIAEREKNERYKAEIKALSPAFFKQNLPTTAQVPEAIRSLPDDPEYLKKQVAKFHRESEHYKKLARQHKENSTRYQSLYEVQYEENERLKDLINNFD